MTMDSPKHSFFQDIGECWSWITSGPIGHEYVIDADRSALVAALGLDADANDDMLKTALDAQASVNPKLWCDEHGLAYSLWDTWQWYALDPGFTGTVD